MTNNSFVYGYHYYNLKPEHNTVERSYTHVSLIKKLSSLMNKKARV